MQQLGPHPEGSVPEPAAVQTPPELPRVILLDALGTIVQLAEPFGRFRQQLDRRGVAVSAAQSRAALKAEMSFYRAHCQSAGDHVRLAALRQRCAELLSELLPQARGLAVEEMLAALLASLRFDPYPDAVRALTRWRAGGARLAVVSNWDVSLHGVLADSGLAQWIDVTVTSAEVGAAKPDSAPFAAALERLEARPSDAVHLGDTFAEDVAGARAAGVTPVLIERGEGPSPAGVAVVSSLDELWLD